MRTFLIFIVFLLSSSLLAADLSALYQQNKALQFTSSEIKALKKFKILLVPGVLAESFSIQGKNQIKMGFIFEDGFREQKRLLQAAELDYHYLNIDTESSPEHNAEMISAEIEKSAKPVLIYSHSKGGLDTLEVFRQRPDLMNRVYGWVSVQSPFWGSTIASMMYENKQLRETGTTLFEWMGGEARGMSSLTVEERKDIMNSDETNHLINQVRKNVKLVNFASYKSNSFGIDTPLEIFRNISVKHDGASDGVVSVKSALMNHHGYAVDFVIEDGVDHLMTMTKYRPDKLDLLNWKRNRYSPSEHTVGLLKLFLK